MTISTPGTVSQLTPAAEFRRMRAEGVVVTLATGRVVKIRPVQLARLLQGGTVPDHLSTFVAQMVWHGAADDDRDMRTKAIEWLEYLDLIAAAALMHPRVVESPTLDDEIEPADLTYGELLEIESVARMPMEAVRRFRREQVGDVDAVAQGEQVRAIAE